MKYYTVIQVQAASPKKDDVPLLVFVRTNNTKRMTLVELGFMSNPKETKLMFQNIPKIAKQLAKGFDENVKREFYNEKM